MAVGDNIRAERKKAGLTQKELGERLGISPVGIAQWENGLRTPKIETLQKISDALNVPISKLMEICDDELLKQVGQLRSRARVSKIEEYLSQLNDEGQEVAVERIRELAEVPRYQDAAARKAAQERHRMLLESPNIDESPGDVEKAYKDYSSHGELPDGYVLPWLRGTEKTEQDTSDNTAEGTAVLPK